MIGYLKGKIIDRLGDSVILEVSGIGYRVSVCPGELVKLDKLVQLELFIYTHVREDTLDLYGFKTKEELILFEMLLEVSGIGPRTALLVMDRGAEPVKNAIMKADLGFFTLVPRLGTKNAQKIIIELKNKLGGLGILELGDTEEVNEAIEALKTIGYTRKEAIERLKGVPEGSVEEKIKWALKK